MANCIYCGGDLITNTEQYYQYHFECRNKGGYPYHTNTPKCKRCGQTLHTVKEQNMDYHYGCCPRNINDNIQLCRICNKPVQNFMDSLNGRHQNCH